MKTRYLAWLSVMTIILSNLFITNRAHVQAQDDIQRIGRGSAYCLAWHPSADILAVSGSAGIWLYTEMLEDINHLEFINGCPSWSPDGNYLITRTEVDREAIYQIYDFKSGTFNPVFTTPLIAQKIWWNFDSSFLGVKTATGITLFETNSQNKITEFHDAVDFSFSETGNRVAIGYATHIDILDLATQSIKHTIVDETAGISQITWSPNEKYMAATSHNHIYVWFVETGGLINSFYEEVVDTFTCDYEPCRIIPISVGEILWTRDSQHLSFISTNFNGPSYRGTSFNTWHVPSNQIIAEIPLGSYVQLEWSPQKDYIFTRSSVGNGYPRSEAINMVNLDEPTGGAIGEIWAFSPNGDFALTTTHRTNKILLHDMANLAVVHEFDPEAHRPRDIAWHFNGQLFASAHLDEVQVWDAESGERIARQLEHLSGSILAWEEDYLIYYSASWGALHSFHSETTRRIYLDEIHPNRVETINFIEIDSNHVSLKSSQIENSMTGNAFKVLNDGYAKSILIYDADDNLLHELANTEFDYIKWQPQSSLLMLANNDTLALFDVNSGNIVSSIDLMSNEYNVVINWHPEGEFVAILDTELTVWQVSTDGTQWTQVRTIPTIEYPRVAWHPTEPRLAIGDGTVLRLVDIVADKTLAMTVISEDYRHKVTSLVWNPAGNQLAFTLWLDTFIYIWEID